MRKYTHETLVGIFVVIGLLCVGYLTVKLGKVSLLGDNSYSLFARFNSVSGLRVGNSVEMLGMEIGKVAGFSGLYFNKNQSITIFGDHINFSQRAAIVADNLFITKPFYLSVRQLLSKSTQLNSFSGQFVVLIKRSVKNNEDRLS